MIDPKYLLSPQSVEDATNFLADTFFPRGEIDPVNLQVVLQWILGRDLEDTETSFALEQLYKRMYLNATKKE